MAGTRDQRKSSAKRALDWAGNSPATAAQSQSVTTGQLCWTGGHRQAGDAWSGVSVADRMATEDLCANQGWAGRATLFFGLTGVFMVVASVLQMQSTGQIRGLGRDSTVRSGQASKPRESLPICTRHGVECLQDTVYSLMLNVAARNVTLYQSILATAITCIHRHHEGSRRVLLHAGRSYLRAAVVHTSETRVYVGRNRDTTHIPTTDHASPSCTGIEQQPTPAVNLAKAKAAANPPRVPCHH